MKLFYPLKRRRIKSEKKIYFHFRPQLSVSGACLVIPVFLIFAAIFAAPIYLHSKLIVPYQDNSTEEDSDWSNIAYCAEDWRFAEDQDADPQRRIYYSIFSMLMQYVIPFLTMTCIYSSIFCYLRYVFVVNFSKKLFIPWKFKTRESTRLTFTSPPNFEGR